MLPPLPTPRWLALPAARAGPRVVQILNTEALNADYTTTGTTIGEVILASNGFAEVYPEHKFQSAWAHPACAHPVCPHGHYEHPPWRAR